MELRGGRKGNENDSQQYRNTASAQVDEIRIHTESC
jgi:hypothetical protein